MQVLAVGSLSKSDPPLWMQNAGYNSWKMQPKQKSTTQQKNVYKPKLPCSSWHTILQSKSLDENLSQWHSSGISFLTPPKPLLSCAVSPSALSQQDPLIWNTKSNLCDSKENTMTCYYSYSLWYKFEVLHKQNINVHSESVMIKMCETLIVLWCVNYYLKNML